MSIGDKEHGPALSRQREVLLLSRRCQKIQQTIPKQGGKNPNDAREIVGETKKELDRETQRAKDFRIIIGFSEGLGEKKKGPENLANHQERKKKSFRGSHFRQEKQLEPDRSWGKARKGKKWEHV